MSVHAISWVLKHSEARGGARLVMIVLADHADRNGGDSYPSVRTIADEARMSERAVQYALAELEKAGEVTNTGVSKWGTRVWQITRMGRGADFAPGAESADLGVQGLHPNRPKEPSTGSSNVSVVPLRTRSSGVKNYVVIERATNDEEAA